MVMKMASYRPDLSNTIPLFLLVPTYTDVSGVDKKTFPTLEDVKQDIDKKTGLPKALLFGSFKSYGGTEKVVNGVFSIENTADIEMFYDPRVKADCRIALETGEVYDILADPEDIDKRHQFLKFKVKRVKGGA